MKKNNFTYILAVVSGLIFGYLLYGSLPLIQAAIVWPSIRGNVGVNSVEGGLMRVYEKILVNTGLTSTGKVKDAHTLGALGVAQYQKRVVNDPATCIDVSTPIVEIASNGMATCRSNVPAQCGSASGGVFTAIPSVDLCEPGSIASAVSDTGFSPTNGNVGPYTWTCTRGTVVNCRAESQGQCNTAFRGRCHSGVPSPFYATLPPPSSQCGPIQTYYWWNCNGSNGAYDMCQDCY